MCGGVWVCVCYSVCVTACVLQHAGNSTELLEIVYYTFWRLVSLTRGLVHTLNATATAWRPRHTMAGELAVLEEGGQVAGRGYPGLIDTLCRLYLALPRLRVGVNLVNQLIYLSVSKSIYSINPSQSGNQTDNQLSSMFL